MAVPPSSSSWIATSTTYTTRELSRLHPHLLGSAHHWCRDLTSRIHDSLHIALDLAVTGRERTGSSVELAVTVLVGGREGSNELDVYLHLGFYVLQVYGTVGAHLVVVGPGRGGRAEVFRLGKERKDLEKMRIGRPLRGVSYCQTMGITFLKAMPGISSLCVERMSVDMKCRRHCK